MNDITAQKKACLAEIERAYQIVETKYGRSVPRVPVEFSNKLTRCAGTAGFTRNRLTGKLTPTRIKLSLPLLRLNGDTFINRTPAHEAMHIAAYALFNNDGHGPVWKGLMRLVGRDEKRTHSMETPARRNTRVHSAQCNCQVHKITAQRVAKMKRGARYICKLCKSDLRLGVSTVPAQPQLVIRELTVPRAEQRAAGVSKADLVRASLRRLKQQGASLDGILDNERMVRIIAQDAGLTSALARTYIKKAWTQV